MPSHTADAEAPRAGLGMMLNGAGLVLQPCTHRGLLQLTCYSWILCTEGRVWPNMINSQEQFSKAVINDPWDCFCKCFYTHFQQKQLKFWALDKVYFLLIWTSINCKNTWTFLLVQANSLTLTLACFTPWPITDLQKKRKNKETRHIQSDLSFGLFSQIQWFTSFQAEYCSWVDTFNSILNLTQCKQEILSSFKTLSHNPPIRAVSGQHSAAWHSPGISSYHLTFLPPISC